MTARPIVEYPDARLLAVSSAIATFGAQERALADDLIDSMKAVNGAGISAVQIGVPVRMLVIDADYAGLPAPLIVLNPELVARAEETRTAQEGCLSFPGVYEEIVRPAAITLRYQDLDGAVQTLSAEGNLAVCLQHEIDHLDGIVFISHLSRLRREMIRRRLDKTQRRR